MSIKTLQDIYRCIHCGHIAARGNSYCRDCGVHFSRKDIAHMEKNTHSALGAIPWNTRDRYRCIHCTTFVAISDKFCRGCGDQIDNREKQLMKLNLEELARQNIPALIGLSIFVLAVIAISIMAVK